MKKSSINLSYVVFLSAVAALGGFLFGYDAAVISGTIAQVSTVFDLNSLQQGWYVGSALTGSILGVSFAGILSDKIGRKKTMISSAVLFSVSAIGCAVCNTYDELIAYRIIGGIGIGVASIVSPLYISEIAITSYRGRLVSLYQLAITVGFLGAFIINYLLLHYSNDGASEITNPFLRNIFFTHSWKAMLGAEAIPAIVFFFVIFSIPESPRWLILKEQYQPALNILHKIYQNTSQATAELNQIKLSTLLNPEKVDLKLLANPRNSKPIIIGVSIAILGQFMGVNAVLYYGPTIFQSSGLSGNDSLFYQVLVGLVNVVTTIIALIIIDKVGRKKLVYFGVTGMIVALLLIGTLFVSNIHTPTSELLLLIGFLSYVFFCAISICAVIWVLLSEMYPTKIRGVAMSIAGFSLWVGTFLIGQLTPWMLENLSPGGTFYLFGVMCIPYLLIVWKLIPETAGKSLEEIEHIWDNNKKI